MTKLAKLRPALTASTAIATALLFASPAVAQSLPDTGNVTSVTAGLSGGAPGSTNPVFSNPNANTLQVDLKDNRTILNWGGNGFNIAAGNTVDFKDARATSGVTGRTDNIAVLNRATFGYWTYSNIAGSLRSDPNVAVYVINPYGLVIGQTGTVDVGSFFASTMNLTNDNDFLNGATSLRFIASGPSGYSNIGVDGQIRTSVRSSANGGRMGDVVLLASERIQIADGGGINAARDVGMVMAGDVTVQSAPNSPLAFVINANTPAVYGASLSVATAGTVTGKNVTLAIAGSGIVGVAGSITANGASATDLGVTLTASVSAPNVTIIPGTSTSTYSQFTSDSGATITSAKDIYVGSANTGRLGTMTATGKIDVRGSQASTGMTAYGPVKGAAISANVGVTFYGKVTTTAGDLTFDHVQDMALNGGADIAGNLVGKSATFGTSGPEVRVAGKIDISTLGRQAWNGTVYSAGPVKLAATNALDEPTINFGGSYGGDFSSDSEISIDSARNVLIGGNITAGGDLQISASNQLTLAYAVVPVTIKAKGALDLTGGGGGIVSEVANGNTVTVQSNSDGIGTEALTLSTSGRINANPFVTLLGGSAQQSDVRLRSAASTDINLGGVRARGLLGASGTDNFAPGITRDAAIRFSDNLDLVQSLILSGTWVGLRNVTVRNGDIKLRSYQIGVSSLLKASNDVELVADAGVEIQPTGQIIGNNVIVSSAGAFWNRRGTDAINAAGHWVIYSANPTGDTFGGLNSGNTAIWGSTLATRAPDTFSGNRYVFAYQPTLTVSTVDFSKIYGSDLTASTGVPFAVTGYHPGVAGAFLGDSAATAFTGSPLITSAGFAPRATVAGGPYAQTTAGAGTLQSAAGYAFAFAPSTGLVTVTPKALTAGVAIDGKTYDGTTTATGTVILNGVVSGDSVGTTGTVLAFADKNAGTGKTVTVTGTTLTGADMGNYTLTVPASVLGDILKKALGVSITVDGKTYDGTTAATGTLEISGVLAGDTVGATGTSFAFADRNAGTGKSVIVATTLTGADAGNYSITISANLVADILKKAITGTVTANDKTYDGTAAGTGSVTLNGVVAGDTVGTAGTVFTFADKNAGTGKTVTVTGTTLSGADAGNYTLTLPASALADILKKALTANITANDKIYDGTTTGTGSVTLNGAVAGDAVGTAGTVFTFADRNAGTGKTVAVSGTSLTGGDAGNYTLTIPASALADILKKALTAEVAVNSKTYDGTTAATGTVSLNGVITGDSVGTTGTVLAFADRNAGSGKAVSINGTTLNGADAGNYTLTVPASALADILKKALTANVVADNKTYDGTNATTGTVTLNGVIAGDAVGTTGTSFAFGDKNAGTGKTVTVTETTLSGADAGNYTLTLPASVVADILKRAITGTITADSKTYDGTNAASGTLTLHGVLASDAVGTSGTVFSFADKTAGTGKSVTASGTVLIGADGGNYTLTIPNGALADILKKAITGTVAIDSRQYDGTTAATGKVTLNGVVAGDNVGTVGSTFAFADKDAGAGKTVSVSGTTLNGTDAGNYTLTLSSSVLGEILRRVLAVSADNVGKDDGDPDPALTFTLKSGSLIAGDTIGGALERAPGEAVGDYAIGKGSLGAGANYQIDFTDGVFTIRPLGPRPQEILQPMKSITLPAQVQQTDAPGGTVTVDPDALCGEDKACTVH